MKDGVPESILSKMSVQEVVNWAVEQMLMLQRDADFHGQDDAEFGWIRPDEIEGCCTDIYPYLVGKENASDELNKFIQDERWPVRIMAKSAMHMLSISTGDKDQFASGSDSLFALSEFIDDLLYEDPDPTEAR
jgi:hypothetical protein